MTERVCLWDQPVSKLKILTPFMGMVQPDQPQERLLAADLDVTGVDTVRSPMAGRVEVVQGSAFSQLKIMGQSLHWVEHQLQVAEPTIASGTVVKRGQVLGKPYGKRLRWQVRILLDEKDGEMLARWNALLFKSPGHPRLQRFIGEWLLDSQNEDWITLLETLERGGGLTTSNQVLEQIGEKGELVATHLRDGVASTAQNTVATVTEVSKGAQAALSPLAESVQPVSATPYVLGGLVMMAVGGIVVWKVLK